ncbi:MAG: RNA methyltransferase [Bacteroidales bacterium]|nr:RNA methyltransferase [Bacteroidales bacterium]
MRKLTMSELNRPSLADFKAKPKIPVVVVLDNIRSLQNVGSIFRTADAFNLEAIYLCGITATPPHREIHRTALGATESVEWKYVERAMDAVNQLKEKKYNIVVVEQTDQSASLSEFVSQKATPLALVFGNEVHGVSEEVIREATIAIEIPQYGTKHSLNVAVAAGIVIWEICRDR